MLKPNDYKLGITLSTVMVMSLSIVCLIQWNDGRQERIQVSSELTKIAQLFEMANARASYYSKGNEGPNAEAEFKIQTDEINALQDYNALLTYYNEKGIDIDELSKLPDEMVPDGLMGKRLSEVTNCSMLNPKMKELDRLQAAQALYELTRWHGMMKTLDSELMMELLKAKEELFRSKEFVDYYDGDEREKIKGVLTYGERIDGGMRIYYYYPEVFPRIYQIRKMQGSIAKACFARLKSVIDET